MPRWKFTIVFMRILNFIWIERKNFLFQKLEKTTVMMNFWVLMNWWMFTRFVFSVQMTSPLYSPPPPTSFFSLLLLPPSSPHAPNHRHSQNFSRGFKVRRGLKSPSPPSFSPHFTSLCPLFTDSSFRSRWRSSSFSSSAPLIPSHYFGFFGGEGS